MGNQDKFEDFIGYKTEWVHLDQRNFGLIYQDYFPKILFLPNLSGIIIGTYL